MNPYQETVTFELKAQINALVEQRNNILNESVLKSVQLALAAKQIGELQNRIEELESESDSLNLDNKPVEETYQG